MHWEQRRYKNKDLVYLLVDENGEAKLQEGKAEIRYQPNGRSYFALPKNIQPVQQRSLDISPSNTEISTTAEQPPTQQSEAKAPPVSATSTTQHTHQPPTPSIDSLAQDSIVIYADGACSGNPGPAGVGVYWQQGQTIKELSEYLGHGTNNIAELTALKRALELCPDNNAPITIYTDSSYVIGLLTQHWKAKANQELVQELRDLARQYKRLQLRKVRGHAGIFGNEQADMLARTAVTSKTTILAEATGSAADQSAQPESTSPQPPLQTEQDKQPESAHPA
jgi:ribonuclease HI